MSAGRGLAEAIRPATTDDLDAMARIHVTSGTPGLLTDLGEAFLRESYYRRLLLDPHGHGLVLEIDGRVVGFVTYSEAADRLFSAIFRSSLVATVRALSSAVVRRPRVARDFLETVQNVSGSAPEKEIPAEIVSLEVDRPYQGLGLGFFLLQAAVRDLGESGATRIKARILQGFPAIERLYARLGFEPGTAFRLHGRAWRFVALPGRPAGNAVVEAG